MTSKNTWDGLQFRIMETLEKAKGVPLTAIEISQRLFESEYKDELYDNIVFKVTRACHAMREKGKIIVTDARDREGRLTYVLPKRVIFPRHDSDTPPVNAVLKPEIAEKILPVTKKEEPETKPERKAPMATTQPYVSYEDRVIGVLDRASHPLTSIEILDIAKAQKWWEDGATGQKLTNRLANVLYRLNEEKRLFQMPSSKRVKGAKYEFYTKKTLRNASASVIAPPDNLPDRDRYHAPAHAKPPVRQKVEETTPLAHSHSAVRTAAPSVFRPGQVQVAKRQLNIDVPSDKYDRYKAAAEKFGVSFTQFVTDALDFALSHAE